MKNEEHPSAGGEGQNPLEFSRALYEHYYAGHGDDVQTLMWSGVPAQEERFFYLSEIDDLNNASVLDVGCGFADLKSYLDKRCTGVSYTGLELVEKIAATARAKHADAEIICTSLDQLDANRRWDYVVESGIFNISCWDLKQVEASLTSMFEKCNKGVAANFLSRYSTNPLNPGGAYFDPADLVTMATTFSRKFSLRHDYRANDFTLYIYRDEKFPGTREVQGPIPESAVRKP